MHEFILEAVNITKDFPGVRALDKVGLKLKKGEILGIVGESGSGKTMTCLSIMRLIPPPGKVVEGQIFLKDTNLLKLSEEKMRKIRGEKISMIFEGHTLILLISGSDCDLRL